jgi:hypothetical protein
VAEIDATMAYAEAEKALATRRAYATDCGAATSPPGAPPGAPCLRTWDPRRLSYPASRIAAANRPPSGAKAAAIGYRHKLAGYEPPTNQEGVRAVLRGIRGSFQTCCALRAWRNPPY